MDSQGAGFAFDANMDFSAFMKPVEDNTSGFFFGDEGIDTTAASFVDPTVFNNTPQQTSFDMQNLAMDNTIGSASLWNTELTPLQHTLNTFPPTPTQSFDALYQQPVELGKRPLQLEVQDYPQAKRHESSDFTLFSSYPSTTATSWTLDAQPTPLASSVEVGLSDEAADVCATWFNKFNMLPSDRHIDSLSQLTGESTDAIRHWFGRLLKQGMGGGDSAYKSQTALVQPQESFWSDSFSTDAVQVSPTQQFLLEETVTPEFDTTAVSQPAGALRGNKKRCTPTEDLQLLGRDPNKVYQCTRKCGKRYGRKCDWKRNEEEGYPCKSWVCSLCTSEGVENVKPCFRKYHFVQHFRNIHPEIDAEEYEEASVVSSETEFPRRCGFCRHRFVSRQERIDHIADHFKQGKCMLDWKEQDVDENDSDNTDDNDDDDRPSGDSFDGSKPSYPPQGDPSGGPDSKHYGGGGSSSDSGGQAPRGGFFQFQLSQFTEGDCGSRSSCANQHIKPTTTLQNQQGLLLSQSGQHISSAGDNNDAVARDAFPRPLADQDSAKPLSAGNASSSGVSEQKFNCAPSFETDNSGICENRQANLHSTPTFCATQTGDISSTSSSNDAKLGAKTLKTQLAYEDRSSSPDLLHPSSKVLKSVPTSSQTFLSVKLLGAGGFSTVDEVVHRETNLRVGRKTLKNRDHTAIEELKQEVNILQKLRHPHVIRFLGAYSKGDKMSILVSPVAETTLALWLERSSLQQTSNLAETIVKMFGCLASSVRYLHEQRPVLNHMDIKPQNILIVEGDQEFPHVVLTDFGISSSDELSDGQSKPLTRQYIAPEVFNGFNRKQAADIWSLGCVFAEMASASFSQGNSAWLSFRKEFSGRTSKYYWQDVSGVQARLSSFLEDASTVTEQTVVRTLQNMLRSEPSERPDAASLTMIFSPAQCCLNWPNDKAIFPGPHEEVDGVEMLVHEDGIDCPVHLQVNGKPTGESSGGLSSAVSWLHGCSKTHEACDHQPLGDFKTLPTRLVDTLPQGKMSSYVRVIDSASIEPGLDRPDYVALTHVWSEEQVTLMSDRMQDMQTELPLQELPHAVSTAISTAQHLGFRYIWVDSLCIIQDSEDDKRQECATMASVFRNAALTVVLDQLASDPVDDNVSSRSSSDTSHLTSLLGSTPSSSFVEPRLPASASLPAIDFMTPGFAWDTRAWALQERLLSRRFLHLGQQMYWECNSLKASETFPRGLSPLVWEKVHSQSPESRPTHRNGHHASRTTSLTSPDVQDKQLLSLAPHRLRDCQSTQKEGDSIGDSMEATQTVLQLDDAEAIATITVHGRLNDIQENVPDILLSRPEPTQHSRANTTHTCSMHTAKHARGNLSRHVKTASGLRNDRAPRATGLSSSTVMPENIDTRTSDKTITLTNANSITATSSITIDDIDGMSNTTGRKENEHSGHSDQYGTVVHVDADNVKSKIQDNGSMSRTNGNRSMSRTNGNRSMSRTNGNRSKKDVKEDSRDLSMDIMG